MLYPDLLISGRYKIIKPIAPGGMSEVWLAKDCTLDRKVAIKTLNLKMIESTNNNLSILENEAKVGAGLIGHPNALITLDFGKYEAGEYDYAFIVSEFIDGYNLEEFITKFKSKIDPDTYYYLSLFISLEILKAIEYAHKKRIQHRDIKPLNIFLSKFGTTKVGDFGLAKFIDAATRSHTLNNFSSPPYCAPEQWLGKKTTYKTDVYQMACTIYQLITGRHTFVVENKVALLNAHLYETPQPLTEVSTLVSEEISEIIAIMLNKEAAERAEMWELNDAIAKELQKYSFVLEITIDTKNNDLVELVDDITDFDSEILKKEGKCIFEVPDFNEVFSEGIQLLCHNINTFRIIPKEKYNTQMT